MYEMTDTWFATVDRINRKCRVSENESGHFKDESMSNIASWNYIMFWVVWALGGLSHFKTVIWKTILGSWFVFATILMFFS